MCYFSVSVSNDLASVCITVSRCLECACCFSVCRSSWHCCIKGGFSPACMLSLPAGILFEIASRVGVSVGCSQSDSYRGGHTGFALIYASVSQLTLLCVSVGLLRLAVTALSAWGGHCTNRACL